MEWDKNNYTFLPSIWSDILLTFFSKVALVCELRDETDNVQKSNRLPGIRKDKEKPRSNLQLDLMS
jgi:hypothetical protein